MNESLVYFYPQEEKETLRTECISTFILEMIVREKALVEELEKNQAEFHRFHEDNGVKGKLKRAAAIITAHEPVDYTQLVEEKNQRIQQLEASLRQCTEGSTALIEALVVRDLNYWCARTIKLQRLKTEREARFCFSPREIEHIKWLWKRGIEVLQEIDCEKYAALEESLLRS